MTRSLTLVVPCYREAARLRPERFLAFLDSAEASRLLFVDDGSPDDTLHVLTRMAAARPEKVGILPLNQNVGKGEAVRRGLLRAMDGGAELVGFWDADLATPLDQVEGFLAIFERHPHVGWVFGSRWRGLGRDIKRNAVRHYASRGFATVVSIMLGLPVYDTQCGAKMFRADETLRALLATPFHARWVFDVELLARLVVEHRGGRMPPIGDYVYELPLVRWLHDGQSRLRWLDFPQALSDLFLIWRRYLGPWHESGQEPFPSRTT